MFELVGLLIVITGLTACTCFALGTCFGVRWVTSKYINSQANVAELVAERQAMAASHRSSKGRRPPTPSGHRSRRHVHSSQPDSASVTLDVYDEDEEMDAEAAAQWDGTTEQDEYDAPARSRRREHRSSRR